MSVRGFFSAKEPPVRRVALSRYKQNLIRCPREVPRQIVVRMYSGRYYSRVVMIKAVIGRVRILSSVDRMTAPATFSSS